jgi:hypothetical protein
MGHGVFALSKGERHMRCLCLSCSKINSLSKLRDIKVMGGTRCPKHYREQEMLLVLLLCKINVLSKNKNYSQYGLCTLFETPRKTMNVCLVCLLCGMMI